MYEPGEPQPSTNGGEGMKGLAALVEKRRAQVNGASVSNNAAKSPSPQSPAPKHRESKEWHLTIPLQDADVRQLRAGDVVYLTGNIFTARDGVFKYMID